MEKLLVSPAGARRQTSWFNDTPDRVWGVALGWLIDDDDDGVAAGVWWLKEVGRALEERREGDVPVAASPADDVVAMSAALDSPEYPSTRHEKR